MRRRIKKVSLDGTESVKSSLKPTRKVAGVEPKRWCPSFDHKGPWEPHGGLSIPDNATPEARELLSASAIGERCAWCGTERLLDSLSMRRKLRGKDFEAARLVRKQEEQAARRASTGRNRFSFSPPKKQFLMARVKGGSVYHLVGRYTAVCGLTFDTVMWGEWAGRGGRGLDSNRCKACHEEVMAISNEQLDVLFAYMLAVGRLNGTRHPNDRVKFYDLDTGRVLLREEYVECDDCESKGMRRPTLRELDDREDDFPAPALVACEHCDKRGWIQKLRS